jgi:phosphoribosylformimino-5-aminoimidazole carboxamide ribotide isomerase
LKVIPAIDIRGGKCVRLHQGDYSRETVYDEDPVAVAKGFVDLGATWIHVVDLDGAKTGQPAYLHFLREIGKLPVRLQTGGGIRSTETIQSLVDVGVDYCILGSALVKDPTLAEIALQKYGKHVIAGLDVRDEKVAVSGWQEQTERDLYETAEWLVSLGCERFVVTDIATDGTLMGPNFELANKFMSRINAHYIVSGGVSSEEDIVFAGKNLVRQPEGIITGKAIYDGKINLSDIFAISL